MSQQAVLEFLEKSKNKNKWFTVREISEKYKLSYSAVSANVKRLRKYKIVNAEKKIIYRNKNKHSPAEIWFYKYKKYEK